MSSDSSYFELGGDASGLVETLRLGGEALLDFASLSEQAQRRIVNALNGLSTGGGGLDRLQSTLLEMGRAVGFDSLLQSLQLVNAQMRDGINYAALLQAQIRNIASYSVNGGPAIPTTPQAALPAGTGGGFDVSGAARGAQEWLDSIRLSETELGRATQEMGVFNAELAAFYSNLLRLNSLRAIGGNEQLALPGSPNRLAIEGRPSDTFSVSSRGTTTNLDSFAASLNDEMRAITAGRQPLAIGGAPQYDYMYAQHEAALKEDADRMKAHAEATQKDTAAMRANAAGGGSGGGGFWDQFMKGFGGGHGKDHDPFAEQLGTIAKYTTFYGLAYTALFKVQQALIAAVQQMEQFQAATVTLADTMGTSQAKVAGLANSLGDIAAANGLSPDQGVLAGSRGIGMFGQTDATAQTQAETARVSAQVATQAATITGQAVQAIQAQIAAVANAYNLGPGGQQSVLDIDAYLSRKFGLAPGSTLAATSQVASTAQTAGFDINQISAAAALIESRMGVPGTTAAGYLQEILSRGGDSSAESRLAALGVNINQSFQGQLAQLSQLQLSHPQQQELFGIFGRGKAGDAALALIQGYGQVTGAASDAAQKSAGAATAEFNHQMNTLKGTLTQLHATALDLLKDLGNSGLLNVMVLLAKASEALLGGMDSLLRLFDDLPEPIRLVASGIGILVAAVALLGRSAIKSAAETEAAAAQQESASAANALNARIVNGELVAADTVNVERTAAANAATRGGALRAGINDLRSRAGRAGAALQESASGGQITAAALAEAAWIASLWSTQRAMNDANAAVERVTVAISGNADAVQNNISQLQQTLDAQKKASTSFTGTVLRGASSLDNMPAWTALLPGIGTGKLVGWAQTGLANLFGRQAPVDAVNQAVAARATDQAALAAAQDYAKKLQDIQTQATQQGSAEAINLTSVDAVNNSFAALVATGSSATDQMNALVGSLQALANGAKAGVGALSPIQQQTLALNTGAAAAQRVASIANNLGVGLHGLDLKDLQATIQDQTASALQAGGGKLTADQERQLVQYAQAKAIAMVGGQAKWDKLSKYTQEAITDGISIGIENTINHSKQDNSTGASGGFDLAAAEAAVQKALATYQAAGSEAGARYLQAHPGDTLGQQRAQIENSIQNLQAVRDAAQQAFNADPSAQNLQALDSLNAALIDLNNQQVSNATQQIEAIGQINAAQVSQYDKLGKLTVQAQTDKAALASSPNDPTLQAKALQDAQAIAAQRLADANAQTMALAKPGDALGQAVAKLTEDQRTLGAIVASGVRSGQDYWNAYAAVQADLNALADVQSQYALAAALVNVDPQDQLAATHAQIKSLQNKIRNVDVPNSLQALQDQAQLNQLLAQAAQQEVAQDLVRRQLAGDTTNPAQMAQAALAAAQEQLSKDRANPLTDQATLQRDQLDVRQKQAAAQQTAFEQQFQQYQTMQQLGQISNQAYLSYLYSEQKLLEDKLKTMKSTSEGYYQAQQDLNQIDQAILAASGSMNAQFNLAGIKIPTPYEVRRYLAATGSGTGYPYGGPGGGFYPSGPAGAYPGGAPAVPIGYGPASPAARSASMVTINISGQDIQAVKNVLNEYLGPKVIDSYASISRKVGG